MASVLPTTTTLLTSGLEDLTLPIDTSEVEPGYIRPIFVVALRLFSCCCDPFVYDVRNGSRNFMLGENFSLFCIHMSL